MVGESITIKVSETPTSGDFLCMIVQQEADIRNESITMPENYNEAVFEISTDDKSIKSIDVEVQDHKIFGRVLAKTIELKNEDHINIKIKIPAKTIGKNLRSYERILRYIVEANQIVAYHCTSRLTATLNLFPIYIKLLVHVL